MAMSMEIGGSSIMFGIGGSDEATVVADKDEEEKETNGGERSWHGGSLEEK